MEAAAAAEGEVPSYFLCPISLQIMRDPVTLSTGITYDRPNIERWLFDLKRTTCPLTNQSLLLIDVDVDDHLIITPNHTLRRLIQAWCSLNAIPRFPTPRPPITKPQLLQLIQESKHNDLITTLHKLKNIASESDRNRRCIESSSDAIDFLISAVDTNLHNPTVLEASLDILCSLQITEKTVDVITADYFISHTMTTVLRTSNCQCRVYATMLLQSIVSVMSVPRVFALKDELFVQIVKVLDERLSYRATKAALQFLCTACPWGRNMMKAVEARAVPAVIELLLDETEKRAIELMLAVLARLTQCAEGRSDMVEHEAGIAVVGKKLVRVSVAASERAVNVMHNIAKFSPPTRVVLKEMLEVGVVSKLCLLIQVDCGEKTKERVKEMLRLHARVWRNSPCVSPQLLCSYP